MRKIAVLFLSLILLGFYSITKHFADSRVRLRDSLTDVRYLPKPELAEWTAIGFKEAMADIYWIEALNYFGSQLAAKKPDRNYQYLEAYTDLIFHLDPLFTFFYDWAATAFIYNGLEITRELLVKAISVANSGIQSLHSVGRYDASLLQKGAFNYALDAQVFKPSLVYFELLGRSFPDFRDRLLVASAYAKASGDLEKSYRYREEYLAYIAYETQDREDLQYAVINVLNSALTQQAFNFARGLRIQMEQDEDLKKLVQNRLVQQGHLVEGQETSSEKESSGDYRFLESVNLANNWLPPSLHLLFQIHDSNR